ncbi:hypothetical protein DFH11DRAFT_650954 [Phellopilus nigrolimitatus]|nr:hypothetical protein DFH11DRAFT_650954 [Phellopilus nigrolimitatus]
MATIRRSSPTSHEEGPLQRGKACINCRRRKMRCDGARPVCTQCISGNRAEDCEYTDNQGRTRTAILEENIALLQARIDELENPDPTAQPVLLHDPYEHYRRTSGEHAVGIAPETGLGQAERVLAAPERPNSVPAVMLWWEFEEPPAEISNMLVTAFLPYASTLGFALSPDRFRSTLSLPTLHPERPHPALLHSVFLWSLRLSKTPDLMQHENSYLRRAILALQDALSGSPSLNESTLARRRVHAIQAEVLLAKYFFSLGRLLEGRYHANAAVSLAVTCGLYRIKPAGLATSPASTSSLPPLALGAMPTGQFELAPARDAVEFGERVRVFWAVYEIDRCWSVALGAPCCLSDEPSSGMRIDTPWPLDISEYEQMNNTSLRSAIEPSHEILRQFLSGRASETRTGEDPSSASLRAKASALYERAAKFVAMWKSAPSQAQARAAVLTDMRAHAHLTTNFARSLIPLDRLDSNVHSLDTRQALFVVHSLAHATMIQLHSVHASEAPAGDESTLNAALEHASEVISIFELAANAGVNEEARAGLVDPILAIVGMSAAQVFVHEHNRIQRDLQTQASQARIRALRANIDRIIEALRLCTGVMNTCPIFNQQMARIQEMTQS